MFLVSNCCSHLVSSIRYILSGVFVGLPDCFERAVPGSLARALAVEEGAAMGDDRAAGDLEMPRRQEFMVKKRRTR
jgi:hypothetical protein